VSNNGTLILGFFDVYRNRLNDRVDVHLKHTEHSHYVDVIDHNATKELVVHGLHPCHGGRYQLQVIPRSYRPVGRFVRVYENYGVRRHLILPIDRRCVTRVEIPAFYELPEDLQRAVDGRGELWETIDVQHRAGLLNLYAKMKYVRFPEYHDVFFFVEEIYHFLPARLFARVHGFLYHLVTHSDRFHEVSGLLHPPQPGWLRKGSYKTRERCGNLQVTFYICPATGEHTADIDIDNHRGTEHAFDVIEHLVTGKDSHPYDIHSILELQGINTGYKVFVE